MRSANSKLQLWLVLHRTNLLVQHYTPSISESVVKEAPANPAEAVQDVVGDADLGVVMVVVDEGEAERLGVGGQDRVDALDSKEAEPDLGCENSTGLAPTKK